jgi:SulP family sulfate permease
MVIASSLFDRWSFEQLKESLRRDAHERRGNVLASVQMGFVVLVGVTVSLVAAVGAGIALSVVVFVAQMTRSPIRRVRTGASVRSARNRDPEMTRILSESGHRIAVIELEGTVFFGTAEALATKAEALADEGTDFVIFDMKRVQGVDATGFKVLGQTFTRLRGRGTTLGFSYVMPDVIRDEIAEDLILSGVPEARMWQSTDRALEYFEEGLLMKLGADEFDEEGWTIAAFGADWGLDADECGALERYVVERFYDGGEMLFEEGDTDRSVMLLRHGTADMSITLPGSSRRHRVATASRGTVLGEVSFLDGRPRAAAAMATSPITAYELTYERFKSLAAEEPNIGVKILDGVARILAERLRRATDSIVDLEA